MRKRKKSNIFKCALLLILALSLIVISLKDSVYSTTGIPGIPLEADPSGIAINPITDIAVISNEKADSVSIVDLTTETVLSTIQVGKFPRGTAIDNELNLAVIGNSFDNTVSIIDLNTFEVITTIPVGKAPEGIEINQNTHTVLVSNHKDSTVSIIDLMSYETIGTITVGREPIDIAIYPNPELDSEPGIALVVNEKDYNISVIDLNTYQVTGTVTVGKKPQAIDINPETGLAVVANEKDNSITVIDLATWDSRTIPVGKHPIDVIINPLDNRALVICEEPVEGSGDRTLLLIDLNTDTIIKNYVINKLSKAVAVNPFTNIAGIVDHKTDSLRLIQLPNPIPELNLITPETIPRGSSAADIGINGSGFIKSSVVDILNPNPQTLTPAFTDNHNLGVEIPEAILQSPGIYRITVTNPAPEGGTSNTLELTVENPIPTITAIDPAETTAGTISLTVDIYGTGFFNDTTVYINGTQRSFTLISQTNLQIELTATDLETGAYLEITASNPTPGGGQSAPAVFTVLNPIPVLSSIDPASIIAGSPDLTLTLTGNNFVNTSIITFNNTQYQTTYISNTQLQTTIPSSAIQTPGDFPVTVTNPAPGGGESSPVIFTVTSPEPPPPETEASGYIDGYVYNARTDSPLSGVSITVAGITGQISTDSEGFFAFPVSDFPSGIPAKEVILTAEKTGYTYGQRRIVIRSKEDRRVDDIYLVPRDTVTTTITPDGGIAVNSRGNIILEFPEGAVNAPIEVNITEYDSSKELPAPLPQTSHFTFAADFQPDGAVFNQPVHIKAENFLGFPPGTTVPVGIYDKNKGAWVPEGTGLISDDGQWMEYDVTHFSPRDFNWSAICSGGGCEPPQGGSDEGGSGDGGSSGGGGDCDGSTTTCCIGGPGGGAPGGGDSGGGDGIKDSSASSVGIRDGSLEIDHKTAGYTVLGKDFHLTLRYNSKNANPQVFIGRTADYSEFDFLPDVIKAEIVFMGERKTGYFQPSGDEFSFRALFEPKDKRGNELYTGFYPSYITLTNRYDRMYYAETTEFGGYPQEIILSVPARVPKYVSKSFSGEILIRNDQNNPFGKGWSIDGVRRLIETYNGMPAVIEGDSYEVFGEKIMFTVAGGGYQLEDGVPATEAQVNPHDVKVDNEGNIYIADYGHYKVRKVDTNGIITTVAGNGQYGYSGDGIPATEARLYRPKGVAADSAGNIYLSSANRVRKVDLNGILTTFAGSGSQGYNGDGIPATDAELFGPTKLAIDDAGNVYIADTYNQRIRKVSTTGIITTIAGNGYRNPFGNYSGYGDGGPATEARLNYPQGVALDRYGNIYITDTFVNRVRKVDTSGIITTVAGAGGFGGFSGDGGPATEASLYYPYDVAVDSAGNIYIADTYNYRIRKVDTNGIITTVAGNGEYGYSGDGLPATEVTLSVPRGIAVDNVGDLYIAGSNRRVMKVTTSYSGSSTVSKSSRNNGTTLTNNPDDTYTMRYKDGFTVQFSPEGLQTSVIDRNGNTTEYVYDAEDRLIQVTDPAGGVTTLSYTNGYLSSITDPQARATTLNIDTDGDLLSITDPDNSITNYSYDGSHRIVSKTLPGDRTSTYIYDSHDMLSSVTLPDGSTKSYVHSIGLGLLNDITSTEQSPAPAVITSTLYDEVIDELSNTTRYRTNRHGLAVEKIDALGRAILTQRDRNSRPLITTSPDGSTIVKTYDIKGNLLTQTDALGNVTTYTYEPTFNQVATITDPKGNISTMEYDTMGNLTKTTDPLGNETTMTYDARGLLTSVTDANGNTIQYQYDSRGNLVKAIDQLGNETTNTRDSAGNTISTTDAEGNITSYEYDVMDNLTKVTDASGGITTYTYTSGGCTNSCSGSSGTSLLSSITDASGNTTSFEYDERGRQTKVINPDSTVITKAYDAKGNLITQTDENGSITQYNFDAVQKLQSVTDPLAGVTGYLYDVVDNLASVADANSNTTTYEYDSLRRLTKTISPDTGITTYTYDTNGNLISKTDANGTIVSYTYDSLNRLLSTIFPDPTDNVSYTYDNCLNGKGRLCSMTDSSGVTGYEYNSRGQVVKETKIIDGITYITEYSYTPNGNLAGITYPDGRVVTYSYIDNRIASVTTTKDSITKTIVSGIAYDSVSLPLAISYGNGIVTDMSYDSRNRLDSLNVATLNQLSYTRDNTGNITSITDALNPAKTKTYTYDALYRLTQADGLWGSLNYNYDSVGNRQAETTDTGITNYLYNANRLASTIGEKTFTFDYNSTGNTIAENSRDYIYNQNQRLIRVSDTVVLGEYTYNGNGQRVKKIAGGTTTIFHYALGSSLIAESDSSGVIRSEYVYLLNQPLAKIENDYVYIYHNNHLATPMVMTDESGSTVWEGEYLPFGEEMSVTGSITNNLRFPGQYYDIETGSHYNYYRDYKPEVGRYLEADPIGIESGQNHLYGYVGNNPVNDIDPSGLFTCKGNWKKIREAWSAFACTCYWRCQPCKGTIIHSDPITTTGKTYDDQYGRKSCLCDKPGPEEKCDDECPVDNTPSWRQGP